MKCVIKYILQYIEYAVCTVYCVLLVCTHNIKNKNKLTHQYTVTTVAKKYIILEGIESERSFLISFFFFVRYTVYTPITKYSG